MPEGGPIVVEKTRYRPDGRSETVWYLCGDQRHSLAEAMEDMRVWLARKTELEEAQNAIESGAMVIGGYESWEGSRAEEVDRELRSEEEDDGA